MIEQTELIVVEWNYTPPVNSLDTLDIISDLTRFDVMKKRAASKKGIACRLSCLFLHGEMPVLNYVAEHSYVIDLDDAIDKNELLRMIRNSFSNFNEKFEFRKLGTILEKKNLSPLDESNIDLDAILPLLI